MDHKYRDNNVFRGPLVDEKYDLANFDVDAETECIASRYIFCMCDIYMPP